MKNILLLVHDDEGQEARLQVALDVARAVKGHLTCLDIAFVPKIAGDFYGATDMLLADEGRNEAINKARLGTLLQHEGVPWDWSDVIGEPSTCLARVAALADLIVVNRGLDTFLSPDVRAVSSKLLKETRTPILAVPHHARALNVSGHALVAWDGSGPANAALRAATPLLSLAGRVTIVTVAQDPVGADPQDAATYLSRHGVHADVIELTEMKSDVASRLSMEGRNRAADYIVMGGFGHGRLEEALFGGVTRTLLGKSPIPLFLAG
ncbi:universal stress protein [Sphingomonas oryzagri]